MATISEMFALALQLHQTGQWQRAKDLYRQVLAVDTKHADAWHLLGMIAHQTGEHELAVLCIGNAIASNATSALFHCNLGAVYHAAGRTEEAVASYRRALALAPDDAEVHNNLGVALLEMGRRDDALASYREALRLNPDHALAHSNLGNLLKEQGRLSEAEDCQRRALAFKPDSAEAHYNLGIALLEQGKLRDAQDHFREALRLKPDYFLAYDNILYCLNLDPSIEPLALFAEHRRWGEIHGPKTPAPSHANDPDPERRVRVGYVSPDLRQHSVAHFIEPILAHHDAVRVETFCYADVHNPDSTTARLQQLTDHWRWTRGLSDKQLAQRIRADRIDVLVDLAGHTSNNRLRVLALKPAPVQVTYLGYPNTTGLTTVDYRLTDDRADPPGEPRVHTEELVRLPDGFCCYQPAPDAPAVSPLPALATGRLTFGAVHNLAKINAQVIDLWCAVLKAVPTSRLMIFRDVLKGKTAEFFQQQFMERGLGRDRVQLLSEAPGGRVLNLYESLDIILDTFPWGGHTTSYEALWMGVPVLTLHGNRHAGRWASSVLTRLGLTEFVADTPEAYVAAAARLAGAIDRLARLRSRLRDMLRTSPLCDRLAFTRRLEDAYRAMWRSWCEMRET